jgi:hypothetical protein
MKQGPLQREVFVVVEKSAGLERQKMMMSMMHSFQQT